MPKTVDEYDDVRLAALYDILNPLSDDSKFYIELTEKLTPKTIIDVGCGTGLLTAKLIAIGRRVIGLEPSATMLKIAESRQEGENIEWVKGDLSQLNNVQADLLIMTGHVAQVFLDDHSWSSNLSLVRSSLHSGGYFAFESRNPDAKAWQNWDKKMSAREISSPEFGKVTVWNELISINNGLARYNNHYIFDDQNEELTAECKIRFRTKDEISDSLINAGFTIESIVGDWNGNPVSEDSRELIFVARRV